jgi:hypothetical protein
LEDKDNKFFVKQNFMLPDLPESGRQSADFKSDF